MCESTVVLLKNGNKEVIMEDVAKIFFSAEGVSLRDILGEKKRHEGARRTEANRVNHECISQEM